MELAKNLVHKAGRWYVRKICATEYENQVFFNHNERPIEYRFALEALGEYHPQTVLDVGTGRTAFPATMRDCGYLVTAIDNVTDYWDDDVMNRHWNVRDVNILNPGTSLKQKFEAITCISVLEHIPEHTTAIRNMAGLLTEKGILILTTPFSASTPYPNVYKHPEALYGQNLPFICRSSSESELKEWLSCGLTLVRRELWKLFTGPVWATGQRCTWQRIGNQTELHQLGCFLFQKNG